MVKIKHCRLCGGEMAKGSSRCPHCGGSIWSVGMGDGLVACKSCGHNIAKSAQTCPSCGFKPHIAAYIASAILITVFTSIMMVLVLNTPSRVDKVAQSPNPVEPETYITISAQTLWDEYSANQVNADNLYNGKLLAVTGTVVDIGQDLITKAPCISLSTGGTISLYPVQCFFPKNGSQNDIISQLSDGDTVTIFGTCEGVSVVHVQLSNCYF